MRDVAHAQLHRGALLLRKVAEIQPIGAPPAVAVCLWRPPLLRGLPIKAQTACLNRRTQHHLQGREVLCISMQTSAYSNVLSNLIHYLHPSRYLFTCLCTCRLFNLLAASHGQQACIEALNVLQVIAGCRQSESAAIILVLRECLSWLHKEMRMSTSLKGLSKVAPEDMVGRGKCTAGGDRFPLAAALPEAEAASCRVAQNFETHTSAISNELLD